MKRSIRLLLAALLVAAVWFALRRQPVAPPHRAVPGPTESASASPTIVPIAHPMAARLVVRIVDDDGRPFPAASIGVVSVPTGSGELLASGSSDANGEARVEPIVPAGTRELRVMAAWYVAKGPLRWAETTLPAAEIAVGIETLVHLRFARESIIKGLILDRNGKPEKGTSVQLAFGWIGGPGDPLMRVFQRLTGAGRVELEMLSDDNGCFEFERVPSVVFVAFQLFNQQGGRYAVETDLPSHEGSPTFYRAQHAGAYNATLRRRTSPELTLAFSLPAGEDATLLTAACLLELVRGDPRGSTSLSGKASADGIVKSRFGLFDGMELAEIHGNRLWVVAHHPTLGSHFHEGRIDTRTLTEHVSIRGPAPIEPVEGFLRDPKNEPVPGVTLELSSDLARSLSPQTAVTDGKGYFRFPGFTRAPEAWMEAVSILSDAWWVRVEKVPPSTVKISFSGEDGSASFKVQVRPGAPAALRLELLRLQKP